LLGWDEVKCNQRFHNNPSVVSSKHQYFFRISRIYLHFYSTKTIFLTRSLHGLETRTWTLVPFGLLGSPSSTPPLRRCCSKRSSWLPFCRQGQDCPPNVLIIRARSELQTAALAGQTVVCPPGIFFHCHAHASAPEAVVPTG